MKKEELRKFKWISQESGEPQSKEILLFHKWVATSSGSGEQPRALGEYSSSGRMTTFSYCEIKFID
jgi:hypothetical protein